MSRERADFTVRVVGPDGADADVFVVNMVTVDTGSASPGDVVTWDGDTFVLITAAAGSLPTGGTDGQVLTKQSSTDGDATWEDIPPAVLQPQAFIFVGTDYVMNTDGTGAHPEARLVAAGIPNGDTHTVTLPDTTGFDTGAFNAVTFVIQGGAGQTQDLVIDCDGDDQILDEGHLVSSITVSNPGGWATLAFLNGDTWQVVDKGQPVPAPFWPTRVRIAAMEARDAVLTGWVDAADPTPGANQYWQATAAGSTIEVEVDLAAGEWQFGVYGPVAPSCGLLAIDIDGDAAGSVDQGNGDLQYGITATRLADSTVVVPVSGRHTLTATTVDDGSGNDNSFVYSIYGYTV